MSFRRINWSLILFLATIGTTSWVGYQYSIPLVERGLLGNPWHGAIAYSFGLLTIIGCHEIGHKLMADRRGVIVTFPYFIPIPFFLGTLGAVIGMKDRPPDRNALFDIGAGGVIAGFLALIPITILGIHWSYLLPKESASGLFPLPTPFLFNWLANSLINIPKGHVLVLHPMALVGFLGMVLTLLNLLPVSILDGGHITRAIFGEKYHRWISFAGAGIAFLMGFWLFAILIFFFTIALKRHPGPINDFTPLSTRRKWLSLGLLGIMVSCSGFFPLLLLLDIPWDIIFERIIK